MGMSKELRIKLYIAICLTFFLLEIIVGYAAHSLALVADAFHMLNDVLSLFVGLWAVRVATNRSSSNEYTYGWARAEFLGGFINGIFLIALCLTIFLEAIQRFVEPQEVTNPLFVLIVGSVGLVFNILGLFFFHDHSHSHGHGHEGEEHTNGTADELSTAESGHAHHHDLDIAVTDSSKYQDDETIIQDQPNSQSLKTPALSAPKGTGVTFAESIKHTSGSGSSPVRPRSASIGNRRSTRSGSRHSNAEDLPIYPAWLRSSIQAQARGDYDYDTGSGGEDYEDGEAEGPSEVTPLITRESSGRNSSPKISKKISEQDDANSGGLHVSHHDHQHAQAKPQSGHTHDTNMRGIFLHVVGDAFGNIGVMASALIIWLCTFPGRYYFDPAISLLITLIILKSAIPLCKDTARPLLQAVPKHISIPAIKQDIESLPGIRSCHHVHVWSLTPSKLIATLDVEVDFDFEGKNAARYMDLAKEIKKCLHGFGIHSSTVQPEFRTNEHRHLAKYSDDNTISSSNTATAPNCSAAHRMADGSDSDPTCLLDCDADCSTGRQCCGPASGQASGTATPKEDSKENQKPDKSKHRKWFGKT